MIPRRPAQYLEGRLLRIDRLAILLALLIAILCVLGWFWTPFLFLGLPLLAVAYWLLLRKGAPLDPSPLVKGRTGELTVAALLAPLESEGHLLVHDLDTGQGNIDHVVVGPRGGFAIEVKHWEGRFYRRRGRLMFNGRDVERVLGQARRGAMEVRRRMQLAGVPGWVEAVIVSTRARVLGAPLKLGPVTVIESEQLPDFIRARRASMSKVDAVRARAAILRGDAPVSVSSISYE